MSGLEVLAVAASVIQIAELGGQLSVKLFTFTRKIKNADKNIDSISQDIATTGAVLKQLGNELKKDEKLRLCSPEAIATAKSLMDECHKIFKDLNDAVDGAGKGFGSGAKMVLSLKQRVRYTFLEPQIDLLKANLEKLKSSLLVMLNVLIFAEQLKNQEALPILKDQKELLKCLVDEQVASQKQYDKVLKRLELLNLAQDNASISQASLDSTAVTNSTLTLVKTTSPSIGAPGSESLIPSLPAHLHDRAEEIFDHCRLVNAVIEEVNHAQYKIDLGIRYRTRELMLDSHYNEWAPELEKDRDHQQKSHTDRYQFLQHVPRLKRHWVRKASPSSTVLAPAFASSGGAARKRRLSPSPPDASRKRSESTESWALSKDALSHNSPASQKDGSPGFNLNFSTLENSDNVENFDFESFLKTTGDDAFNFDEANDGLKLNSGSSAVSKANEAERGSSFQLRTQSFTPLVSSADSPLTGIVDSTIVRQGRPEPPTAEPSRETPSVHVGRPRSDSQPLSPSEEPAQARRKNLAGPEAVSSIETQRKKLETAYSDEAIATRNAEIQAKRDRLTDLRRQRQLREETRGQDEDNLVMLDKKQISDDDALSDSHQRVHPPSSAVADYAVDQPTLKQPRSPLEAPQTSSSTKGPGRVRPRDVQRSSERPIKRRDVRADTDSTPEDRIPNTVNDSPSKPPGGLDSKVSEDHDSAFSKFHDFDPVPAFGEAVTEIQSVSQEENNTSVLLQKTESPGMLKINETAQTSSFLPPEDPSLEPSTASEQSRKPVKHAVGHNMPLSFIGYTYKTFNTRGEADNEIATENKDNAASGPWEFSQSTSNVQFQPPTPPQAWSEPEPDALYQNGRNPYITSSGTDTAADRRRSCSQDASNLALFLRTERLSKSINDIREQNKQALNSLQALLDSSIENQETEIVKVESELLRRLLREYTNLGW